MLKNPMLKDLRFCLQSFNINSLTFRYTYIRIYAYINIYIFTYVYMLIVKYFTNAVSITCEKFHKHLWKNSQIRIAVPVPALISRGNRIFLEIGARAWAAMP